MRDRDAASACLGARAARDVQPVSAVNPSEANRERAAREVLVATDLGEGADEAILQGDEWARREGVPLVVCHVMPDLLRVHRLLPHLSSRDVEAVPSLQARVREALLDRVRRITGREDVAVVLEEGPCVATLLRVVAERRPQLLVVGSGERHPLERAFVGSTAAQLCRHAPVSVLAARRNRTSSPMSPVIAATDFSPVAELALLRADVQAAQRGVPLAIVHALDIGHPVLAAFDASSVLPRAAIDSLRASCRQLLATAHERLRTAGPAVVADGGPGPAVARAARELQAQLVVVGTHGHTGLRHLALGSAAEAILQRAPCSVLVARPE